MQGRSYISAGACVRAPGLRCVLYACMHAGGSTMHACIGPHLYYYPGPRAFHVLRPRARHDLQHIIREKSREKCRRKLLAHACPRRVIISAAAKRGEINFSARLCILGTWEEWATRRIAQRSHRWRVSIFVDIWSCRLSSPMLFYTLKDQIIFLFRHTGLKVYSNIIPD